MAVGRECNWRVLTLIGHLVWRGVINHDGRMRDVWSERFPACGPLLSILRKVLNKINNTSLVYDGFS